MNNLKNYMYVWKNTMNYRGRASRTEYWSFWLTNIILMVICFLLGGEVLFGVFNVIIFLPTLSVSIRRLHDTNKSGFWWLVGLVPFLGIMVLVFYLKSSDTGRNDYGKLINEGYYYL